MRDTLNELCVAQEEKMARYSGALVKIMAKGPGISVGTHLAIEVQKDVFNEQFPAVVFSMSLLKLVSEVK